MPGKRAVANLESVYHLIEDIPLEALPPAWTAFDLASFSPSKRLYDYQQEALAAALRALWLYYCHLVPYDPQEPLSRNLERKRALLAWYQRRKVSASLDIPLRNLRPGLRSLLLEYFPAQADVIPSFHFVNRIGFWMATGSGKTIVLVKLVEVLWRLARAR